MSQTIADLARHVHRWIAVEDLLFTTLGGWARDLHGPAAKRVLAEWCHRHAWHADLWRQRMPALDVAGGTDDDVEAWLAPLRTALADVASVEEAVAALRQSVLPALEAAVAEHRGAIDPLLDGPTARVLTLVAADLAAEASDLADPSVSG